MNKFVTSAVVLSTIGGAASATSGSDSEWSGLDSQLETIRSSYTADAHDMLASVGGLVASSFLFADAEVANGFGGNADAEDDLGFTLDNALLWGEGQVSDRFSWRIRLDGTDGIGVSVGLGEAFGDWDFGNGVLRMGHFMPTTARYAGYEREAQLFARAPIFLSAAMLPMGPALSYLGSAGEGAVDYVVSAHNGADGSTNDEFGIGGRIQWNMNGGVGRNEGAFGSADGFVGTIGVFADQRGDNAGGVAGADGGTLAGADLAFTGGTWSAGATFVNTDNVADTSPYMVQGSFLVDPESSEIALRYEDNDDDTTRITVGYNWYQQGTNAMWQINAGQHEVNANVDGTFFSVTWVLGETGHNADPGNGRRF